MKIVIDSNVIIAAFATHGLCSEVLELCLAEHDIFLCDVIIYEVRKALINKLKIPHRIVKDIIDFINEQSNKVKPSELPKNVCRNPKDLVILSIAETSGADIILTGDKDLLVLRKYKRTRIVAPAEFWKLLRG